MKKSFLVTALAFAFVSLSISCSDNSDILDQNATNLKRTTFSTESSLDSIYGKANYIYGKKVDISDTGEDLTIQKVTVAGNTNEILYVVTDNNRNHEIDYIAKVDLSSKIVHSNNFVTGRN